MPLTQTEQRDIVSRVAAAEGRTGAQVVVAVVGKCDAYPEVFWKAFALGAAAGVFAVALGSVLRPGWPVGHGALIAAVASLGAGASLALLAVLARPVARLLLDDHRVEGEVRQHAEALFLRHELFRTRERVGILLLASEFERKVLILPDSGVRSRVSDEELGVVIETMRPQLASGRTSDGLAAGLTALEELLEGKGFSRGGGDEIRESLVQEKGE